MTVRQFLEEYNKKEGYGTSESELIEVLDECGKVVWKGDDDQHRWYIIRPTVKDIDGTFIMYDDYVITGDGCMSDMGLDYDIDGAKIVKRKERNVVEVYYE